jgi:RND family efflux transporter MFP subunit
MVRIFWAAIVAIGLATAAAIGYTRFGQETVTRVQAVRVERGDLQSYVKATGVVTSREEVAVLAPVSGIVTMPVPAVGKAVHKGEVLARIDAREAVEKRQQSQAALAAINEEVKQLQRNYESLEKVWAAGGEPRRSVNDALSTLNIAIARRNSTQSEVNAAKLALELYSISSPIAGIVTTSDARRGEFVPAAKKLLTLAATENVQVKLKVDQSAAELVKVGQPVELVRESREGIDRERIVQIEPAIQKDGSTDILVAWVSLASPPLANRRLDQQVDAKILVAERHDALKIPFETIAVTGGKELVRVVENGTVRDRQIVTGIQDTRMIEVLRGLAQGELVVLPGAGSKVKPGDRVEAEVRESRP